MTFFYLIVIAATTATTSSTIVLSVVYRSVIHQLNTYFFYRKLKHMDKAYFKLSLDCDPVYPYL